MALRQKSREKLTRPIAAPRNQLQQLFMGGVRNDPASNLDRLRSDLNRVVTRPERPQRPERPPRPEKPPRPERQERPPRLEKRIR